MKDPSLLHARARVACDSFNLAEPKPVDPTPPPPGIEEEEEPSFVWAPIDAGPDATGDAGFEQIYRPQPRHVVHPSRMGRDEKQRNIFTLTERGSRCLAAVTAWYDTNGNGKVDTGDFVGAMAVTQFADRGLCAGNTTNVGPIAMTPWTP